MFFSFVGVALSGLSLWACAAFCEFFVAGKGRDRWVCRLLGTWGVGDGAVGWGGRAGAGVVGVVGIRGGGWGVRGICGGGKVGCV